MLLLNDESLQPGDIILTSAPGKASRFIRTATRSQYSHAMLYVASNAAIHSDLAGVHAANLQRLTFSSENKPLVLRLKNPLEQESIRRLCNYARSLIGTQYSIPQAATSALARKQDYIRKTNRQFCSRLVAEAYAEVSIKLVQNPSFCFPSDLINYDLLTQVDAPLRPVDRIDAKYLNRPNPLEFHIDLTNELFRRLREASDEDIQSQDQVVECLLRRPQLDQDFSDVLLSSGYSEMWRSDLAANPWRYHRSTREKTSISEALRLLEVRESTKDLRQFRQVAHDYNVLFGASPRQYFLIMRTLYLDLYAVQSIRLQLASEA